MNVINNDDMKILQALYGESERTPHNHSVVTKLNLNPAFIEKTGATEEDLDRVIEIHAELHEVFDTMAALDADDEQLLEFGKVVTDLDFQLQDAWGFDRDANYHTWWFQVPHCKCPVLDNWDLVGTDLAIRQDGCPVHGKVGS